MACDASGTHIGAVLSQNHDDQLHPVAFHSRKLTPAETNYPTHERELLAIVDAAKRWRHYLLGNSADLVTDHQSLRYIQTQPYLSPRQTRWAEMLQEYDFDIRYRPGKENIVADALSRPEEAPIITITMDTFLDQVREAYQQDSTCSSILRKIKEGQIPNGTEEHQIKNGLLFRGKRLVIPNSPNLHLLILHDLHDAPIAGHFGRAKTLQRVKQRYTWKGIDQTIADYVNSCTHCQRNKNRTHQPYGQLQPLPIPTDRWQSLSWDFIVHLPHTKKGHDAIWVVVDRLTKRARFIPTTTELSAPGLAQLFFDHVVRQYGLPAEVISDRDPRFTSLFWRSLMSIMGVRLGMSTAFHPQTDGQTERTNRTLEEMLRHYTNFHQDDWDDHLATAELAYNTAEQSSTGQTPFFTDTGRHPRLPHEVTPPDATSVSAVTDLVKHMHDTVTQARSALQKAQESQALYANRKREDCEFEVGDQVLPRATNFLLPAQRLQPARKLQPRFLGPYTITAKFSPVTYRIQLPATVRFHNVFHISQLERYHPNQDNLFPGRIEPPPPPILIADDEGPHQEWEVERILDMRQRKHGRGQRREYLVKWKGYPDHDLSWEPATYLRHAQDAIREYKNNCTDKSRTT